MSDTPDIHAMIRRRMIETGMTQAELSRRTGIAPESISKYYCGHMWIGMPNLEKIMGALDLKIVASAPDGA